MSNPKLTDRVIEQGRALAYAVEAIDSVEIKDPLERAVAGFFQAACERRLQDIVETSPDWVNDKIFCPAGTETGEIDNNRQTSYYLSSITHIPI